MAIVQALPRKVTDGSGLGAWYAMNGGLEAACGRSRTLDGAWSLFKTSSKRPPASFPANPERTIASESIMQEILNRLQGGHMTLPLLIRHRPLLVSSRCGAIDHGNLVAIKIEPVMKTQYPTFRNDTCGWIFNDLGN
jgi:hypothetical protein